ncbi:hypothetical protein V8F20_004190 [Naviculisporaceae sp. PSN 640]
MHSRAGFIGLLTFFFPGNVSARLTAGFPPITSLQPEILGERAASTSSIPSPPQVSEDPWLCVKENITSYFLHVPRPTGNVQSGINSYNDKLNERCFATATGTDILGCTIKDPKQWCGFTTAAPPSIIESYSTYASEVTSFWKENSESISKLSTSCPASWAKPGPIKRAYLDLAIAHAECFLKGNPTASQTTPPTGAVTNPTTVTTIKATTTTSKGVNLRALEAIGLVVMGIAVIAGAA